MKKSVLVAVGFVAGTAVLIASFFGLAVVLELMNHMILILPKAIDLEGTANFGAALGSNALAYLTFSKISKWKGSQIAFSIWVIVLWVIYLTLCLLGGDYDLLLIPIVGIVINGVVIAETFNDAKEERESKKKAAQDRTETVMAMVERLADKAEMDVDEYIRTVRIEEKRADGMSEDEARKAVEKEDGDRA